MRILEADCTKHAAELPSGNMPGPNGDEDGDPWTLRDVEDCLEWAAGSADFPTLEDHLEFTDDSGNQFQGEINLGRVVTSLVGPTAVRRHSVIGVPAHGKGMGDALGFVIKVKVDEGVRCRRLLLQGTRNHVLYLAQHHPKPKGDPGALLFRKRWKRGSECSWRCPPPKCSCCTSTARPGKPAGCTKCRPT